MNKSYNEILNETVYTETLDNGLTLVVLHKEKNVNTSVYLAFPYGSLNINQVNESGEVSAFHPGLAHFLEHKLFENHNGMDVMERFSELSCNVNAFTSYNETVYYFNTARQDIQEPLDLLLDFVQELNITEASVEKEKKIIIQELHMYHQMPESRLMYETFQSLYHAHPVKFDIGGSDESVMAITKEELEQCYHLNYQPNKSMLVIVTSLDHESISTMVKANQAKKHFALPVKLSDVKVNEPAEVVVGEKIVPMDIQSSKMTYAFKLQPQDLTEIQSATLEWQLKMGMELLFTSLNPDYENWIRSGLIHDYFGYDIEINTDYWYAMFYGETEDKEAFIALIDRVLATDIRPLLPYLKQLKRRYLSYTYRLMDDQDDYAIHYLRNAFFHLSIEDTIRIIDELDEEAVVAAMKTLKTDNKTVVVIQKTQTGQND
jgi:predicted Zn-dependent peptidase